MGHCSRNGWRAQTWKVTQYRFPKQNLLQKPVHHHHDKAWCFRTPGQDEREDDNGFSTTWKYFMDSRCIQDNLGKIERVTLGGKGRQERGAVCSNSSGCHVLLLRKKEPQHHTGCLAKLGGQEEKGSRETRPWGDFQVPWRGPSRCKRSLELEVTLEIIPTHSIGRQENRLREQKGFLWLSSLIHPTGTVCAGLCSTVRQASWWDNWYRNHTGSPWWQTIQSVSQLAQDQICLYVFSFAK